jgi:RNA polymerase sigma factor (sigma-70 family)
VTRRPGITAEEALANAEWVARLARALSRDSADAGDLAQEAWEAALEADPSQRRGSLRAWLTGVARNLARMRARKGLRRQQHESEAAAELAGSPPSPEDLVERLEAQQRVAQLMLELDQPIREVLYLRFYEGLSSSEIGRRLGLPAGTVRWRSKQGLDDLRARLDRSYGDRRRWTFLLLPAATNGSGTTLWGAFAVKKATTALGLLLLLLLGAGGIVAIVRHAGTSGSGDQTAGHSSAPTASGGALWRTGGTERPLPGWLAQPGLEARRIAGRVTTLEGVPIKGASVELASLATAGGLVEGPRLITNAAGEFNFGLQLAMTYSVSASAAGLTGSTQTIDLRSPIARPRPDEMELRLGPCDAAMVGSVRDASGGPVAAARVAWVPGGQFDTIITGAAVETDLAGNFELCVERGREIDAQVSAEGYGAIVVRTTVRGRESFDFSLVPEATVVGRVIREDTGKPVANAHVRLSPGQWGFERTASRASFSGSDGRFRISGVAPGSHVLAAVGDRLATARETPIVVEAGQTTEEMELVLETRSTVRGRVIDGGKPVAGAVVAARTGDAGRQSADAVSQEDGSFVLDRVPRGQVRFAARPYQVMRPDTFEITRPQHDDVIIEVDPLGVIAGRVLRRGRPVDAALIVLRGPNAAEIGPVRTGVDGRFEARGLSAGEWKVIGSSERDGAFSPAQEVDLERGQRAEVTIDLTYGAAISGVVVDQDGAPVPAVSVEFRHSGRDDLGFATTAKDGSFRAATMMGGARYLTTIRRRWNATERLRPASGGEFPPITLADGTSEVTGVVLAVRLDRLSIAGRVADESGAPVPDARVAAEMMSPGVATRFGRWFHQASTVTDVDGRFSIGELSAGPYALQARSSVGAESTIDEVAAGSQNVAIVLPSPGSIEGTLVGFREVPRVFASRRDAHSSGTVTHGVVSGTTFTMKTVTPGTYLLDARTGTEAASARVEVTAGRTSSVTLSTTGSSGIVTGRVRDFRSGAPVEGMTCVPWPRVGIDRTTGWVGDGVRTDPDGRFELTSVPAGDIAIFCHGRGSYADAAYTNGQRLISMAPGQRLEIDVPVVKMSEGGVLAGIGAELDHGVFVPRLHRVQPAGPAASAGLQDADIVIAVDATPVTELSPLGVWVLITNRPPGTTVKVTVRRGPNTLTRNLVLGPPDPD